MRTEKEPGHPPDGEDPQEEAVRQLLIDHARTPIPAPVMEAVLAAIGQEARTRDSLMANEADLATPAPQALLGRVHQQDSSRAPAEAD